MPPHSATPALRMAPAVPAPVVAPRKPQAPNFHTSTKRQHQTTMQPPPPPPQPASPTGADAARVSTAPPHQRVAAAPRGRTYRLHNGGQLTWRPPQPPLPPASMGGLTGAGALTWRPITTHSMEVSYLDEARRRGVRAVLGSSPGEEVDAAAAAPTQRPQTDPAGGSSVGASCTSHVASCASLNPHEAEVRIEPAAGGGDGGGASADDAPPYRIYPLEKPSSRAEALWLAQTFEAMVGACGGDAGAEEEACDVVLKELVRQVGVHCAERGALLEGVRARCATLRGRRCDEATEAHQHAETHRQAALAAEARATAAEAALAEQRVAHAKEVALLRAAAAHSHSK